MFDYAKISRMLEFENKGCFPLQNGNGLRETVKDIFRILLHRGPVRKPYIKVNENRGRSGVFRFGTRGWEYPWVIDQLAFLPKGAKLIDCGCGTSQLLQEFNRLGFATTGLDFFLTDEQYKKANYGVPDSFRKKFAHKISFINGGMHDIPAEENSFEVVTCISVMEHVVISSPNDPSFHIRCLDEMKRVLKPGGVLVCTYDTLVDGDCVFAGTPDWGPNGWYYADDIQYLGMKPLNPVDGIRSREEISNDEDTFFIPPDIYFQMGFGQGFYKAATYHRLTSVGFALVK
jgi:SAM-dependent methyltransferase